jgi:hypothetical protein
MNFWFCPGVTYLVAVRRRSIGGLVRVALCSAVDAPSPAAPSVGEVSCGGEERGKVWPVAGAA